MKEKLCKPVNLNNIGIFNSNMPVVEVVDAMVGAGKTSWAIEEMNKNSDKPYIFVTPYLDEVDRILEKCPHFEAPEKNNYKESKLANIKNLLLNGKSIVTTHSLFKGFDQECYELIEDNGYRLILDEVITTVKIFKEDSQDIEILKDAGRISVDPVTNEIRWLDMEYNAKKFKSFMKSVLKGNVYLVQLSGGNYIVAWEMPVEKFVHFSEVTILTYLFEGQEMSAYFKINHIPYILYSLDEKGNRIPYDKRTENREAWKNLIKVYDGKMNNNYLEKNAKCPICKKSKCNCNTKLSASWYKDKKRNSAGIAQINKNLANFFKRYATGGTKVSMWSCYKENIYDLCNNYCNDDKVKNSNFISFNARATNDYRDRYNLAYVINVYANPVVVQYFKGMCSDEDFDTIFNQDLYAVSTLIQWLGRSAIREQEGVYLYLPSARMRDLLEKWINYEL